MRVNIFRIVFPCHGGPDDYALQHKATVTVNAMADAARLADDLRLGSFKLIKVSDED
jgi:hypothetical protein